MWKIAIVDDDFQVLSGLRSIIPWEELDAEFVGDAIDGEEGLQLISTAQPDLVITDIYMPGMNGIEMIERLRENDFHGRFIILSGYNDFESARKAIRLGVDDYFTKPVTVDQVRNVILSTIEKLEESYLLQIEREELKKRNSINDEESSEKEWFRLVMGSDFHSEENTPIPPIHWKDSQPIVLVLEVAKTDRIKAISLADWNLFKFAISNIAKEILEQCDMQSVYFWQFGTYATIILNPNKTLPAQDRINRCRELGGSICKAVNQYIGVSLKVGLGRVGVGVERIRLSMDEALKTLMDDESTTEAGQGITQESTTQTNPKHRKAIEFMIEYAHENFYKDITLEVLANQLYISKNYLNQLFKRETGDTFTNYIIRVRIEKAKALIMEGKYLIYEIAEMVGYQNVPYFSSIFKKYCGCSPSEYQKRD
ncbi:response regulator [Paenibacillus illinoisensis]|uniref:response regulator transcription factor n=1 Tax=Paenibacillus illinoisensis TaxID=59845 RepID=UPI003CEA3D8B